MRSSSITTLSTYAILACVSGLAFLMPSALPVAHADPPRTPDVVRIAGSARDFRRDHPDFAFAPEEETGHIAGNVELALGRGRRPVAQRRFTAVTTPSVERVAGWSFDEGNGTVAGDASGDHDGVLRNRPTWISDGKFGGAIEFDGVNDFVEVPHDPAFLLDTMTVTLWFRVDDPVPVQGLVSKDSNSFDDGGHFTIYLTERKVTWRLQSKTTSFSCTSPEGSIQANTWYHIAASFGPGGMELFLDGDLVSINPYPGGLGTSSGGTGNEEPWSFGVAQWSSGDHTSDGWLKPLKGAMDDIQVFSTHLTIEDFERIGGSRVELEWTDSSGREIAPQLAGVDLGGCPAPHDSMGFFGVESAGGISSSATFDRWFRDALGTNMSMIRSIVLTRNEEDVYEFLTDAFFPVDSRLLGNEGDPHNYYFTYAFTTTFDYHPCSGQFIEFKGGDGAWMFIDGRLVLDLGGVESSARQYVEIDRLGLQAGVANPHTVRFFYADRSAGEAVFRLRTNVKFSGSTPAGLQISGGFD